MGHLLGYSPLVEGVINSAPFLFLCLSWLALGVWVTPFLWLAQFFWVSLIVWLALDCWVSLIVWLTLLSRTGLPVAVSH
ncbi:hypothetical protein ES703_88236 [subsurface metagenome]|jgi:hypothetical protein